MIYIFREMGPKRKGTKTAKPKKKEVVEISDGESDCEDTNAESNCFILSVLLFS